MYLLIVSSSNRFQKKRCICSKSLKDDKLRKNFEKIWTVPWMFQVPKFGVFPSIKLLVCFFEVNSTHDIIFDGQMTSNTTMLSFFICILIAYMFMSHWLLIKNHTSSQKLYARTKWDMRLWTPNNMT